MEVVIIVPGDLMQIFLYTTLCHLLMNSEKGPESLHRAKTEDITKELREQREARGAKKEAIMCLLRDFFEPSEAI